MASRKPSDSRPQILEVSPAAAIPGGEFQVRGKNFAGAGRASVTIGAAPAPLVVGSDSTATPAVDSHGNIYATFSGSRGQKTPVSIFQVESTTGQTVPFVSELMNA